MIRGNNKVLFLLGILVLTGMQLTFSPQKAHAAQGPDGIPGWVISRLNTRCADYGYVASQTAWLSLSSDTLTTSASIPANQTYTLSLKWNRIAKKCPGKSLGSLLATNFIVHGVSPVIPGLFLQTGAVSYVGMTDALPYSVTSTSFTYDVGPFTNAQSISIGILSKGINWNGGSKFQCIRTPDSPAPPDGIPVNINDFNKCNAVGSAIADFWVDVYPGLPSPVQTITNTCIGINVVTNGIQVDVYKNSISPPNIVGSMIPPDQNFDLVSRGVSPGQALQVASGGDGVNTVGHKIDPWTWQPPTNCGFTITPTVDSPVLSPDTEEPDSVDFVIKLNLASPRSVNGVEIKCEYFIDYYGGRPDLSLGTVDETRTLVPGATTGANRCAATYAVSGLVAGDQLCAKAKANPKTGDVDAAGTISSPGAPTEWVQNCEPVVDKPYLSFLGGDVATGGDFGGVTCSSVSTGMKAFSKPGGLGSGVEFAAMAFGAGAITGFATAQQHGAYDSLAFANDSATLGAFGGSHCIKDYYNSADVAAATPASGSNIIVSTLTTGNSKYSCTTYCTLHGSLQNSIRSRLYINGNLLIDDPVTYASSSWGSVAEIPSLHVYVSGNIYIKNTVENMVGVYVAQPRPAPATNTGEIITCTDGSGTAIAGANLFNDCGTQLKVRGALVAGKIKWLRTANSLRNAGASDASFGSNMGAEVVELSPEFLMVAPPDPIPLPGKGYQYFTTLPPVL